MEVSPMSDFRPERKLSLVESQYPDPWSDETILAKEPWRAHRIDTVHVFEDPSSGVLWYGDGTTYAATVYPLGNSNLVDHITAMLRPGFRFPAHWHSGEEVFEVRQGVLLTRLMPFDAEWTVELAAAGQKIIVPAFVAHESWVPVDGRPTVTEIRVHQPNLSFKVAEERAYPEF